MAYNKEPLDFNEQIELFIQRGMKVNDKDKAIESLKNINYYKIKEFAMPYYIKVEEDGQIIQKYEKISFEQILNRFYQDKNLRIYFLHAVEKVEVSFKTRFAYVLGKKGKAFGYLNFKDWCNRDKYCRYYLAEKQDETKNYIKKILKRDTNFIINNYFFENPEQEFPPIWMLIEILTFGDVLSLYELMSKKNRKEIASFYNCTDDELESWLYSLKLVRNLAAHNSCIIDMSFRTKPIIRKEWHKYLYTYQLKDGSIVTTDKIALIFVILKYLVARVNSKYTFGDSKNALSKLIRNSDIAAHKYGFAGKNIDWLFEKW